LQSLPRLHQDVLLAVKTGDVVDRQELALVYVTALE